MLKKQWSAGTAYTEIRTKPILRILLVTQKTTQVYTKLRLSEEVHKEILLKSSLLGCWNKISNTW